VDIYLTYADNIFKQLRGYLISLLFLFTLYFLFTILSIIKNKRLQNIGILILALTTILGLSELFLRYLIPVQIGEISFANYQPSSNPDIIIEPRPNAGEFNRMGSGIRYTPGKNRRGIPDYRKSGILWLTV